MGRWANWWSGACLFLMPLSLPVQAAEPTLVGWLEPILFPDAGLRLVARLDTGATTSTLDAEEIEPFEKNGEAWVRFSLRTKGDEGDPTPFEARLIGARKLRAALGKESWPLFELSGSVSLANAGGPTSPSVRSEA